ncbi:GGDEF domain-containing protein [Pseudomonas vanderleydeniana]|uniref:diguanylate cyclase n=1 Tax=Pseudomonas vanderleydeniana TaxID=2745495 RepID=A0A9E6PG39_9PSED|nr:GGDEF domain-containing protein [Pseudomonas vanderleydeniana]QXI26212.1 GGDEF domain-containing protein [Pseudomonas vanderleydeniana]
MLSYSIFLYDLLDGQRNIDWLPNLILVAAQTMMMLGVFRFLGRPLPRSLLPATLLAQAAVEYFRSQGAPQALVDAAYCAIVVVLAIVVLNILRRYQTVGEVRSIRLFIYCSLLVYGVVHVLRLAIGVMGIAPQIFPPDSIPMLSFFTGLPFLVISLVAFTAMSLHRTLAQSRDYEIAARANLHRFEQLMRISSAAMLLLRKGRIEDSNPKLGELFGCRREALHGLAFEALFLPGAEPVDPPGTPQHCVAVRADQSTFQAEVVMLELDEQQCLAEIRDVSRQKTLETQLRELAHADPLTGALNRRAFAARFEAFRQSFRPSCVALLDLDHFKRINDHFGHDVGDEVLITFTRLCQAHARTGDVFARMGGEEFLFLLPGCELAAAQGFLERLVQEMASLRFRGLPKGTTVSFSAGLADCPPGAELNAVLKQADLALYRAKANGRARVEL